MLEQQLEPLLPLLVGGAEGLEPRRHLGHRVGQDAERVVAPNAGPGVQIPRRHPPGRGDQSVPPAGPIPLQPEPDGDADREEPEDRVGVRRLVHGYSFNSDRRTLVYSQTFKFG